MFQYNNKLLHTPSERPATATSAAPPNRWTTGKERFPFRYGEGAGLTAHLFRYFEVAVAVEREHVLHLLGGVGDEGDFLWLHLPALLHLLQQADKPRVPGDIQPCGEPP